jgi:hypothetical protein
VKNECLTTLYDLISQRPLAALAPTPAALEALVTLEVSLRTTQIKGEKRFDGQTAGEGGATYTRFMPLITAPHIAKHCMRHDRGQGGLINQGGPAAMPPL